MKRIVALLLALAMVLSLAACGSKTDADTTTTAAPQGSEAAGDNAGTPSAEKEDVKLVMWGAEEDQAMLREMADAFIALHADEANITIEIGVQSESTAKDTVLTDVEAAADVYAFADDQLLQLVAANALQPVTENLDAIKSANSAGSVEAASIDGTLYAYPMTASNGYFLFYNSEYFTEEDVQSMDRILEVADAAGKKVAMDISNGWYIYSFFQGAGLELVLNEDGQTNSCNWNATDTAIKGVDVAQGIVDIASSSAFVDMSDEQMVTAIAEGTLIACVNGTWRADTAQQAWGENYAAAKLPTYTAAGQQVQMASYSGYKLLGVNPYSQYVGWAMELADYITSEENQLKRFEMRGEGPSNSNAAASEAVLAAPAIAALAAQAQYAVPQRVGNNLWTPAETLGSILVSGNAGSDLQSVLDEAVAGITAPVS